MPVAHRRPGRLLMLAAAVIVVPAVAAAPSAGAEEPPAAGETVVGELVQAFAEEHPAGASGAAAGPLSWIETGDGEAVRVPTEDVAGVEPGATVEVVVGDEVADPSPAAAHLEPAVEVLAADVLAAAPADPPVARTATGVTNAVTVVMAVPAGTAPDTRSLADVVDAVNGPVSDYWYEQTDGAVRLGVTASFGWFPATSGCANPYGLLNEAAARAGWVRGPNKHLLVHLPVTATDCAAGLAEVGSSITSGGRLYVRETATAVTAHELGHNFGLGHASDAKIHPGTADGSGPRVTA